MTIIYNIGIVLYYILIFLASPFNKKAKLWIDGRKDVFHYLKNNIPPKTKLAWFHVSSLGEFEQGRPIIEAFKVEFPDFKILLTFFSPSGYEIKKDYQVADYICYLPLDTPKNAKRFIQLTNPELVFFVKYDYWYHFLKQAKKSGAKLLLISGVFRNNQAFFKWYGAWYRQILTWFEQLFVQNTESAELLNKFGFTKNSISGDSRFDRVVQIAQNGKNIDVADAFTKNTLTIVCGSTWPADEEFLLKYIQETKHHIKLIIAPHEIHKAHIASIEKATKLPYILYSQANKSELQNSKILIIDNIGLLSSLYKYGNIAYIGGGFGVSIHNTLEAAVYKIPVIFGPNYHKFKEATDLIKNGGAKNFSTYSDLKKILDNLISDKLALKEAGITAGNYVHSNTGATQKVIEFLKIS
jgi:3-deoxy-D-manno-octulosonic-acid transferase